MYNLHIGSVGFKPIWLSDVSLETYFLKIICKTSKEISPFSKKHVPFTSVSTHRSLSTAWHIRTFYKPLYATGKYTPPSAGLLNSAPVLCCRKKCKPGTSPGLVQQQYSELINKKQTIVWQFFWCMCLLPGNPPVWQCRREIVFLKRTSPAIFQLKQLSRPGAWFARYLT